MDTTILVSTIIVATLAITILYHFLSRIGRRLDKITQDRDSSQDTMIVNLNQRIDDLSRNVSDNLQRITENVLNQLNENTRQVNDRLKNSNQDWLKHAQDNLNSVSQVTAKLAKMEESNQRIFDIGKDIASLQEILRAPKLRGILGELFLGDLLSQIFPRERYRLQYAFRSGEIVDAVLILRDGHLVSIDAKFPLESFKRILESPDEDSKRRARKEFQQSIRKRIDEVANKYIAPEQGTLDFALMYIPAENVYYETIVKGENDLGEITQYAYSKRVIPVSPNNLYIYLQTIALGLRGMQIEERAKEILHDLVRLNTEFGKVFESYEILGKHLSSASSRYEETSKYLSVFGTKIEQIESRTNTTELPTTA